MWRQNHIFRSSAFDSCMSFIHRCKRNGEESCISSFLNRVLYVAFQFGGFWFFTGLDRKRLHKEIRALFLNAKKRTWTKSHSNTSFSHSDESAVMCTSSSLFWLAWFQVNKAQCSVLFSCENKVYNKWCNLHGFLSFFHLNSVKHLSGRCERVYILNNT